MIKAGIIGSTGYAGAELVRLLLQHPEAEIVWYGSRSYTGKKYADIYRNMFQIVDADCLGDDLDELAKQADVIFTATPQGFCASVIGDGILENTKVIDLSADFRLKRVDVYEQWYHLTHKAPSYIKEAVYGLCEINRDKIAGARLIANPGCYTTTSILTLYPLVKEGLIDLKSIIVDAKSGTSGAGRGAKVPNLFCEVNESIKPYGVTTHRHTPEIEEQLSYAAGLDYMG
ncbi:MAG TPA: N-acetyl-gamma-glutamyl-phosphate reductase, partial [Lachnospiraceae bacterium]|nr:N-acetyl-gamma-glutamyl-phosphate reductase [Lachnospiraceae bacterium]